MKNEIKNPSLIKFIKDYEAYYAKKEDDRQAKNYFEKLDREQEKNNG